MRQTSRPLCSHGAESASNGKMEAGIAPHIASPRCGSGTTVSRVFTRFGARSIAAFAPTNDERFECDGLL
jgi:hypothetical protein